MKSRQKLVKYRQKLVNNILLILKEELFMDYFYENRYEMLDDETPLSIYRNQDFSYRAHWHTEVEILYVESGALVVSINDDRRKLVKGEFSICTSGDIHYYESDGPSVVIILVFKPEYYGLGDGWPVNRKFVSPFIKPNDLAEKNYSALVEILYSILEEKKAKLFQYKNIVKGLLIEYCGLILRHIETEIISDISGNSSHVQGIQNVLEYIEINYTSEISLQALAKNFNMDQYNLSKKFNIMTGNNLKTHINKLRVKKAEDMLKNSNKKIIDIALECGFDSIRTFNRTFKTIYGDIPSSLR